MLSAEEGAVVSPSPGIHLVGVHPSETLPRRHSGLTLPIGSRVIFQATVAAVVSFAMAVRLTGERIHAMIAVAGIIAAIAGVRAATSPRGGLIAPCSPWGVTRRFAVAAAAAAVAIGVAGEAGAWTLTTTQGLLLAVGGLGTASLAGLAIGCFASRTDRVLVVGTGVVAHHLATSISRGRRGTVVGLVDDGRLPTRVAGDFPTLGDLGDVEALVGANDVDLVVFSFLGTGDLELSGVVAACRAAGAEVAVVSRLFGALDGDLGLGRVEGFPVVTAHARGPRIVDAITTRATDIVLASILLILTAPLWLALSLAILLDSPGGVVYRARRLGRYGEPFSMLKFRKMKADAAGPALTLADDDRFTRMGRFLARSKLDELPQLVNVLRGQMSFVGPRPEDTRYVSIQADAYEKILTVRPGITGLNQIGFRREFEHFVGPDFEEYYLRELLPLKLAVDRFYVDYRSWWVDMRILAWTAAALVRGGQLDVDNLGLHVAFRTLGGRRH